ncbi:MAG: hypothetical protein Ct9H300mP18_11910 [Candidatus Neomarinimicrobiota bacterium]|nr:MAG: hypothetical protein Ct9H300mP18_11910 [Candidatus Neomarinimicrobiota bacterium]
MCMGMVDQKKLLVRYGEPFQETKFFSHKVGWDMGAYEYYYHPTHMRSQMEKSLINLQTDCVDLMYFTSL